jgi:endonuclease YncB( thermonuclease family)
LKCISVSALAVAVVLALAPSASAAPASAADRDCADFSTQAAAQDHFIALGGPGSDPDRLDGDGDGIACEDNPCPCNHSSTPTQPTQPLPPDGDGDGAPDASDSCPSEYAPTTNGCPATQPPGRLRFHAYVTAVTDGDTIKVRRGFRRYTIRLIGIDTPETRKPGTPIECGGREATSRMYRLAFTRPRDTDHDGLYDRKGGKGRRVKVTTDPTQDLRDQYGRLLAYVSSARGNLAAAQLRAGWASVYVFENPFEQLATFHAAEASARNSSRGAWGKCAGNFHRPASALASATEAPSRAANHPQLHRGCTNTLLGGYYVGVGHVRCPFAVRSARRMISGGAKPRGWRCTIHAGGLFGTCTSLGRTFHWAGAE